MPEHPDHTNLESDTWPRVSREKYGDRKAPPASFLANPDKEKHEHERLK